MVKIFTACLATAFAGSFAAAAPVFADGPDRFEPPAVIETLAAGESTEVDKVLHLTGLPAQADIIVAIDTTGSMSAALTAAKADAVDICNDVKAAIPGARFAAVEFQDYPISPYGAPTDSPYELHTAGYTADCATFGVGVAAMTLGSGGDGPESNNRVHFEAYSDPLLLSTRQPEATRFLVMLADNRPHSTVTFGACANTGTLSDPGRNNINESGAGDDIETPAAIAGLNADDHTLLYISYIGGTAPLACHVDLAQATGGEAVADEDAEDIGAFIIDQAQEVEYTVDLVVAGPGCQTPAGLNISFAPAPPYGPFQGEAHVNFTETITAPNLAGDYSCTVTAVMDPGGPRAEQTINVTVTPGEPATVVVTPPTDTNTVGDEHCVTATVRDLFGNPVPDVEVVFDVPTAPATGANPSAGADTTDSSGEAQFCWTASLPGEDTVRAAVDSNGNGELDPTDQPSGAATKTWILPPSTEFCEVKITQGGWIIAINGDRASFGGNARVDADGNVQGQQQYTDHGPAQPRSVHSIELLATTCSEDLTTASIFGNATIDGSGMFVFRIDVTDQGEPGSDDSYGIMMSDGYASGQQPLEGGNVTIHKN